jgi:hypothetical protein
MNRYDTFEPTGPPRHGGRRAGAGRPPAYTEPLLRKTVTLPESYVAHLAAYGRGNLSEGIRMLVEFACTPFGTPWLPPADHAPTAAKPGEETGPPHTARAGPAGHSPAPGHPRATRPAHRGLPPRRKI